jgi:hypothetical protein
MASMAAPFVKLLEVTIYRGSVPTMLEAVRAYAAVLPLGASAEVRARAWTRIMNAEGLSRAPAAAPDVEAAAAPTETGKKPRFLAHLVKTLDSLVRFQLWLGHTMADALFPTNLAKPTVSAAVDAVVVLVGHRRRCVTRMSRSSRPHAAQRWRWRSATRTGTRR